MSRDCKYCGAYISPNLDSCPACGRKVKTEKSDESDAYTYYKNRNASASAQTEAKQEPVYTYKQEYERRYGQGQRTGEVKHSNQRQNPKKRVVREPNYGEPEIKDKLFGYLCYLDILFLIPLIFRRDCDFVRFHCNQGLVLFLFSLVLELAGGLLMGWLIGVAGGVFKIVCVIKGLINVTRGEMTSLPLIGGIKLI